MLRRYIRDFHPQNSCARMQSTSASSSCSRERCSSCGGRQTNGSPNRRRRTKLKRGRERPKQKDEQAKKEKEKEPNAAKEGPKEPPKVEPPTPIEPPTLIALRAAITSTPRAAYHAQGGGVQQVVLPRFEEADRLGRPVERRRGQCRFRSTSFPVLRRYARSISREDYRRAGSHPGQSEPDHFFARGAVLHHLPLPDARRQTPRYRTSVRSTGRVVSEERPTERRTEGCFRSGPRRPVLREVPQDVHARSEGLPHQPEASKLKSNAVARGCEGQGKLRYQLSGPRGLPIEGEWYATDRIAMRSSAGCDANGHRGASSKTLRPSA